MGNSRPTEGGLDHKGEERKGGVSGWVGIDHIVSGYGRVRTDGEP